MRDQFNGYARRLPTWVVYLTGAVPFGLLVYGAFFGGLGADPVKTLELELGVWGLRFLIASLAITPLMTYGIRLLKFRRSLGLLGFFYILMHFTTWVVLDLGLRWGQIGSELVKRPFIVVGFVAFLLLIPLAATSWNGAIRRIAPFHEVAASGISSRNARNPITMKGRLTSSDPICPQRNPRSSTTQVVKCIRI